MDSARATRDDGGGRIEWNLRTGMCDLPRDIRLRLGTNRMVILRSAMPLVRSVAHLSAQHCRGAPGPSSRGYVTAVAANHLWRVMLFDLTGDTRYAESKHDCGFAVCGKIALHVSGGASSCAGAKARSSWQCNHGTPEFEAARACADSIEREPTP
jgi:hypothetical protein